MVYGYYKGGLCSTRIQEHRFYTGSYLNPMSIYLMTIHKYQLSELQGWRYL